LYQANVELAARAPVSPPLPEIPLIEIPASLDASEAYQRLLFHGPHFQVIQRLGGLDETGVDATLARVHGADWTDGNGQELVADPLVLDAGPQLALVWSRMNHDTTPLPSGVDNFYRYGPMNGDAIDAYFRVAPGADGYMHRADVWFVREGRVIALLEGLESAATPSLNRLAGQVTS
jgi:hypothetical protein